MAWGPFNAGSGGQSGAVESLILSDTVTGEHYALLVEKGRLTIVGVSDALESTDMMFIDTATGTAYELTVESGRLTLKEV